MPNITEPGPVPRSNSVNAELIGGVVGGILLSVLITGIAVLMISCFCHYRYVRAAKLSLKTVNQ